jgi:hypothetical protein
MGAGPGQQFGLPHMQQRASPHNPNPAQLQYQQPFPHNPPMAYQSPGGGQDQLMGFGGVPSRLGSMSGLGAGLSGITPSPHLSQGSPTTPMSVPAHLLTPGALAGINQQGVCAIVCA